VDNLIGWAAVSDETWQPSFTATRAGLYLTYTGACPRCRHQTMLRIAGVNAALSGRSTREDARPFAMFCRCGYPHPGHPDDDMGCGAYWSEQMRA
jgi:hypothetical protein